MFYDAPDEGHNLKQIEVVTTKVALTSSGFLFLLHTDVGGVVPETPLLCFYSVSSKHQIILKQPGTVVLSKLKQE